MRTTLLDLPLPVAPAFDQQRDDLIVLHDDDGNQYLASTCPSYEGDDWRFTGLALHVHGRLQSANAAKAQATNDRREEHQTKITTLEMRKP